jgi:hypothetical protein
MLFQDGYTTRVAFLNYIYDNNAYWVDTNMIKNPVTAETFPVHTYLSLDGNKRVVMAMPYEDIPKDIAKGWLKELGI